MRFNGRKLIFWLNIVLLVIALLGSAISGYFAFLETPSGQHGAWGGTSLAGILWLPAIIAFFVRSRILSAALFVTYLFLLRVMLPAFFEFLGGRTLNSLFHKWSTSLSIPILFPLYACLALAALLWGLRKIIDVIVAARRPPTTTI